MTETPHLSLKFEQLEKAKQIAQNSVPKIQRVPHHLRDRENFAKHYLPRLVSIGPIHHGAEKLQLGEKYKLMWAAMYLERTKQDAQTLYQKIASNIEQLKDLFAEDVIRDFPDDEKLSWSWMLFVDGCSLLQILEKGELQDPKEMNVKVDQLVLVWQDVLLLENQLPYHVLKLLSDHEDDAKLVKSMNEFLKCHHLSPELRSKKQDIGNSMTKDEHRALDEEGYTSVYVKNEDILHGEHKIEISQESPIHLLDQLRRYVLDDPHKKQKNETGNVKKEDQNTNEDLDMTTYRNIQELRAAGIKLKRDKSRRRLRDVSFSYRWMCLCAELTLPQITVDDTTTPTFLNLIAYEMCPDFKNNFEICSFVVFMDSLIDHPEDVKELRAAKVLHNALGSDEDVAKLFNTISADLVPDMESYLHVRRQIEKHYRSKYRTWIALGYHTYFSNPWAVIAFHAALVVLVLTFIQTWFTIHPIG
ncbi:hypothetical protein GLYMA_19G074300v4 [Glycine max]|uniref:Uncharacterized protein n=1 Tax=Glycine max TaxID=3847 RepID=I1N7D3_SOYBN|nr:UPF0481 protein At3g47200 [Glycine max]KAH1076780.1 hypothetical protein GYH30_052335 [Glycine max]KRG94301.1 hypothetical protein GLYMA_19G074300v4 [Glycine max]|eukprot:XP_003555119.2 UPF0481 protein At3g47200 [Glycine max]